MTITHGDVLPDAELSRLGADGPETVNLSELTKGRKVVIFGLPGAYTGTCTTSHVPSFMRNMDALKEKGVDEVICFAVNDPFVMAAWGESTGATEAGITFLADPAAQLTLALGLEFTAPPVGFFDRCKRHAMVVENGTVTVLKVDSNPGECNLSAGESILDEL